MDIQKITDVVQRLNVLLTDNSTEVSDETKVMILNMQTSFVDSLNLIANKLCKDVSKDTTLIKMADKIKFISWIKSSKIGKQHRDCYFSNEKYYDEFFKNFIVVTDNPSDVISKEELLRKFSAFLRKKHNIVLNDDQVKYGPGASKVDRRNLLCTDFINIFLYRRKGIYMKNQTVDKTNVQQFIRIQVLQP